MTEAALASADAPHAPQVILQLLAKLGIACREVSDSAELPAARRVQAVLLDDAVGTLLVLFPQSQLLDLARLTELTGRKLLAIKPERLERMLGKHELHRLPALPPLTSSPCLYDERLLQEPRLLIESGQPGILLEIASNDFRGLLGKASAARFGEPLENINLNLDRPDDDRAEISQAVPPGASSSAWSRPSRFHRCRRRRRRSSSCGSTPTPASTTSPAWWKPIRRSPPRWSVGRPRPTTPLRARSARWKTRSSASSVSTW